MLRVLAPRIRLWSCSVKSEPDPVLRLSLVGVNTFLPKEHGGEIAAEIELIRSTKEEKGQQIENVAGYEGSRNAYAADGLKALQANAR